jgi:hypothetical protein
VDTHTAIRINGKPASVTDLVAGQRVHVLYLDRGGVLLALRVSAQKLKGTDKGTRGDGRQNEGKGQEKGQGKGHGQGKGQDHRNRHPGKNLAGDGGAGSKGARGHGNGKGHGKGHSETGTDGDAGQTPEKGSDDTGENDG